MENLSSLKVVELKERLEVLGLSTDGLKAVLVDRLKAHLESSALNEKIETGDSSPKRQMQKSDASPSRESRSKSPVKQSDSSPKSQTNNGQASSPKHNPESDAASAAELAKKRAERFGIPVYTEKPNEEKKVEPVLVVLTEKKVDEEKPTQNAMEEFRELITASLPADCIVLTIEDLMGDGRNAKPMRQYIETNGEEKLKEAIGEMVKKISEEFENDRAKIQVPVKLAAFRLSKTLRFGKFEKRTRERDVGKERDAGKDRDGGKKKTWTDEEWAEWSKKKGGSSDSAWKKDSWASSKRKNYDDDYKKNAKKSRSSDPFESDVEEFIRSNRLDKRSGEVMRTESKGMAEYVMDCGFNLNKYDNPSKEVMLRMKEYIQKKRGRNQRHTKPNRHSASRSRSPMQVDAARIPPVHSRSRSRSDSRDRYDRRSRSVSV